MIKYVLFPGKVKYGDHFINVSARQLALFWHVNLNECLVITDDPRDRERLKWCGGLIPLFPQWNGDYRELPEVHADDSAGQSYPVIPS